MTDASASALDIDTDTAVIRQIRLCGVDLLCNQDPDAGTRDEPEMWRAAFVMAPWISDATDRPTDTAGGLISPPRTSNDPSLQTTSPWHGVVRHGGWRSDSHGLRYDGPTDPLRPGGWSLTLTWAIGRDCLDLRLTAEAGDKPCSLTMGWHPWFRRQILDSTAVIDLGPAAQAQTPGRDPHWGPVPRGPLDHYIRTPDEVTLTWPGVGRLAVRSSSQEYLVFDSEPHGICVEPVMTPAGRATCIPAGQSEILKIHLRFLPTQHSEANQPPGAERARR